jgi:hypothetical protein
MIWIASYKEVRSLTKIGTKYKSQSMIAKEYIKDNIQKKKRNEIIEHLQKVTSLKLYTIGAIYKEVNEEINLEIRNRIKAKKKEEEEIIKYKGKKRKFFYFDDSSLYKEVKEN